jgi:hypothetical protein
MWLVAHNRYWIADRLAQRGLPHPEHCLLCDHEEENIQHLFIGCVFARQFWYDILHSIGLAALAPQPNVSSFDDWWDKVVLTVSDDARKGPNSLIILGAWTIWKHQNDCVFNGCVPRLSTALNLAQEKALLWSLAGAKGLSPAHRS